jgi:hypothetical protein
MVHDIPATGDSQVLTEIGFTEQPIGGINDVPEG